MDALSEIELLALVDKVAFELKNHLGVYDKTLAEFIIAQRVESDTLETFKRKIVETSGVSFTISLIESIDRFVRMMHPSVKAKTDTTEREPDKRGSIEKKAQVFSDLALLDKAPVQDSIDDTLFSLEVLQSSTRKHKSQMRKRDRSRSLSHEPQANQHSRSRRYDTNKGDQQTHRQRRHRQGAYGDDEQQDNEKRFRRSPPEMDDTPILHKIYDGYVTGIKDFGAFVELNGIKGKASGLVHISQMADRRINHPSDVVERGHTVKVKVTNIDGTKIGLSMKSIDQETGQDFAPQASFGSGANVQILAEGRNGHIDNGFQNLDLPKRVRKRLTSPERWEIRQLIASGVARASDYPDLREDYDATLGADDVMKLEEDCDIEVRHEEPPFLAGQTKQSLDLSPIRVIKAPEGSLNRAAMSGTALAKERKELQQREVDGAADEKATIDLSAQWNDPMADPEKKNFASDSKSVRANTTKSDSIPEWKRAVQPKDQSYGKKVNMTIKEQREFLPVFAFRNLLIESVRQHQILIVVGETGSGKTTQTTQYLAEAGFANNGIIGCTQPRRVAAMSVAKRVAEEVGCVLGQEVGYSIRFEDCTSPATKIKYMTDGMLQREILQDPELVRYSVIMLDEAHERTIATDVLFALLKKALKKRSDLKVIVTSATLNAEKFSSYFNDAPIFTIPGRTYPVEILYSREPESDYLDAALVTVMQIHLTEPAGDILLFLTGQEEIDTSCEILYERMKALGSNVPELIILPVYSALPTEMQSRIFEPALSRKIVIATNIAETSITIDNIYYVIDPGFVKQKAYDPKLGMDSLIVTPISQAQANQRAGRAGRTGPGKCFRLYTEIAYQSEMLPSTIPDIQRQNISNTILMLKAMGINDLLRFDFMDPPPINATLTALEELYTLGALDNEGLLTSLGRKMTYFPMVPPLAKVLLASVKLGCSDEMISIVAMLNLASVFYRPKEKQTQADQKKAKFHDEHGDHLTLLNVYNSWKRSGYSTTWCFENFIQARSMRQAKNVREQLISIMERCHHPVVSCGRETEKVRRALCAGFFRNTARRDAGAGAGCYKTIIESTAVYLHPSSALFGKSAEWVVYHEVVLTTREYMHWSTSIEPKWLVEEVPTFFKITGMDGTMSKRQRQERIQPLYNKFAGEDDWRLSAQRRAGRSGGGTWG
ncbi:P-loop containing nucleoside triphosphate hydrolase protein [Melanomma pulvis-pyrius CBS 109.77]|uniref:RNA helicase n=1 Tax=Melanomma pulvis-pyrius CBS 109.77 TaxID=1314802 RepID=A0A6A6XLT4_9PLEO|nr:P-loop containing nucleoside triphosphate hydrolase protein [Melanomma pulvis-pyrius CBS 109.77]